MSKTTWHRRSSALGERRAKNLCFRLRNNPLSVHHGSAVPGRRAQLASGRNALVPVHYSVALTRRFSDKTGL
ncbi:hypothetical protein [Caballeronia sp. Lep1P3]|uniref:hypothetical protein n=1 Tax=Caballeronia sp. Lep1P3 TaxID=2878150 RepID=UPI001FD25C34|nr:hypothetical protein [Caballeronia sp. Lep1P3]